MHCRTIGDFIVYTWSMDAHTATSAAAQFSAPLRREWVLLLSFITTALFLLFGKGWMEHLAQPLWFTLLLAWLFCVIVASAFAVPFLPLLLPFCRYGALY